MRRGGGGGGGGAVSRTSTAMVRCAVELKPLLLYDVLLRCHLAHQHGEV